MVSGIISSLEAQASLMSQVLSQYGITMRLVKIRLSCEDNPACIEYVYRIECKSKELCDRLREEIKREYIGE